MTARPRYPKTTCAIIGCRRISTLFVGEWMCGNHWRMVDRALKTFRTRRLKQLYAAWEKVFAEYQAVQTKETWLRVKRAADAWDRADGITWRRMKKQATERSLGLA